MNRRIAVVVGGVQGIGFAVCQKLVQDCESLAVVDINGAAATKAAKKLSGENAKVIGLGADITDKAQVAAARKTIEDELGSPTILVNSAAIVDDKRFLESSPEDWKRMIDVCLYGPMNVLHEFLPGMVDGGYGRVVCLASDSYKLGQARLSYYAAAKGGVVALVKSIGQEIGRNGVNLNVVSPGATNTEMRKEREKGLMEEMGPKKYEKRQKAVLRLYPAGRLGEPDDVASAVHFLTTDNASWIMGQVLSVNGGFTMA